MKLSSSTPARVLASTRAGVHEQSPKPMSPSRYPPSAATEWNATLRLAGLHGHTPGPSVAAFAARASQLIAIANRWIPDDLDYLDVGGGFYGGVPAWSPEADGPPPRFADYAEALHEPAGGIRKGR